jgi:protein-S-isoprenylcysteine O-methyltransferase Ste14
MNIKKPMPPTLFLGAIVSMAGLHLLLPGGRLCLPWRWVPGVVLILLGIVLNVWADRLFKQHATTVKPFQESSSLITEGVFRLSRHPMYLGMVLILVGLALLVGSLTPWIVVVAFGILADSVFIRPEESMLEETFGEEYRRYRGRVRKWL